MWLKGIYTCNSIQYFGVHGSPLFVMGILLEFIIYEWGGEKIFEYH